MTVIVKSLAIFDNGAFTVDYAYDDETMTILKIIVNNSGKRNYALAARVVLTDVKYDITSDKNVLLIDQSMPQDEVNRLGLTLNPKNGRLDGVEWEVIELDGLQL